MSTPRLSIGSARLGFGLAVGMAASVAAPVFAVVEPVVALGHAAGVFSLSWHGEDDHTYFIQHSPDLRIWTTVPLIESGNDAPLVWAMESNAERNFWRLLASDLPTGGDPEAADFDGDGLTNLVEVNLGSNPVSLDSDRDGMPDAWEYAHGFDLIQPGDAFANEDNDALSNLAEHLAGTNPVVADANAAASTFDLVLTSH